MTRRLLRGDRKRPSSSFHQKKEAVVIRTQVKNLPSALQNDLHSYVLRVYDRKSGTILPLKSDRRAANFAAYLAV